MTRHSRGPEGEVARRWWSLPLGSDLPLHSGGAYHLIFPGYAGGGAGPDVRDAVLSYLEPRRTSVLWWQNTQGSQGSHRLCGDVEFHIRSSDWVAHGHHLDPRYNAVILHVVLICDDDVTHRQDGFHVPICPLPNLVAASILPLIISTIPIWPCHFIVKQMNEEQLNKVLLHAGLLRFEQKTQRFLEQLHMVAPVEDFDPYDLCLVPALAEGLGYGRDRDFFRALGFRLLRGFGDLPEPLGHEPSPSPLDARRLRVLARLLACWRIPGAWLTLRVLFGQAANPRALLDILRVAFCQLGLSLARADILICNVVLPFASAVALLETRIAMADLAREAYLQQSGLPSNRITRLMSAQLQLTREPAGACRQQGLHYIYQQTCREKHCSICIMGKNDI